MSMVIRTPRIWYVCNKCNEWFHYPKDNPPAKCPDCQIGVLIKTCANCGEDFDKCTCKAKPKL